MKLDRGLTTYLFFSFLFFFSTFVFFNLSTAIAADYERQQQELAASAPFTELDMADNEDSGEDVEEEGDEEDSNGEM